MGWKKVEFCLVIVDLPGVLSLTRSHRMQPAGLAPVSNRLAEIQSAGG